MNYYYLAASLPSLSLDHAPTLSSEQFTSLCDEHLSRPDREGLRELTDAGIEPNHRFVSDWREKEAQLRNAVVRVRAQRLNADASEHLREQRESGPDADGAVSEAYARPTPLERERSLDRFRWSQAEALAGFNPFSGRAVLAYAVRLMLAERWAAMDEDAGERKTNEIVNAEPAPGNP